MGRKALPGEQQNAAPTLHLSGTNLARAGDHNQRVTLHAVRLNGPVTRTDLALKTGLTPAAIANITNRLLKDRLILNAGRLRGARGQPASKFVINPDSWFSIGLNVDRDHVTLVVLDFVGKVRARASREIHFAKPAAVRSFFQRSVGQLLAKAGIAPTASSGWAWHFPTTSPGHICRTSRPTTPRGPDVRVDDLIRDVLGNPGLHRERCRGRGDRRDAIRLRPPLPEFLLPAAHRGTRRRPGRRWRLLARGQWAQRRNRLVAGPQCRGRGEPAAKHRVALQFVQPPGR